MSYQPYVRPCFLPTTMHLEIMYNSFPLFFEKKLGIFSSTTCKQTADKLKPTEKLIWNAMKKSMQKIQEPRYWFVYLLYSYTKTNIWCKMQKFTYSNLIRFEYTYFCILHQRYLTSFQQKNRSQTMKYFPKSQYSMALCLLGSGGL